MKPVSRLERLPTMGAEVRLQFDGQVIVAHAGDSVAAAVLSATGAATRTAPVSGAGRAPYCMMGVCFECLMTIDGVPNSQSCMVAVREGMVVATQADARALGMSGGSE